MEETERTGGGVDEEPKKEEGAIGPIRHMFGNQISCQARIQDHYSEADERD